MSYTVSVIIVNWNVANLLRACLLSLRQQVDCDLQIIVVDNASTDNSVKMVREEFPEVELIANQINRGFAAANNQALRQATAEAILFLNPDTIVPEGSIGLMAKQLQADPTTAIVAPMIQNHDGSVQASIRRDPNGLNQSLVLLKLINLAPWLPGLRSYLQLDFDYTKRQTVQQVKGAAFMMKRSILEQLGGWDEQFFLWFEEVDLCRRVRQAGYQLLYLPEAAIIHYGGASFEQTYTRRKQTLFNQSLRYYASKHLNYFERLILYLTLPINLILTMVWSVIKK